MILNVGTALNHYSITEKLGEGGMGAVYAADDTQLGRRVAIKVLPPRLASDPERLRRFEREARTVASLNHPNVVTLYSVEAADDTRFLTMELIDGDPLSEFVGEDGMSLKEFFRLALPLVEAVASAHAGGVTHRDLKPSNIMVDRQGRVKVLDFGLAKLTEGHPLVADSDSDSELPTDILTGAGVIVGTVAYMAPEQAEGKPVDARSDIFSLGVLFYEMITGGPPFLGDSPVSVLSAILRVDPEPATAVRQGVPRQLQRILDRCLAKDPARRYQTVLGLRNALDALRDEIRVEAVRSGELHLDTRPMDVSLDAGAGAAVGTGALARLAPLLRPLALLAIGGIAGAATVVGTRGEQIIAQPTNEPAPVWELAPLMQSLDQMPTAPAFSPDEPFIVYSADHNGQRDLFRVPVAGGEPEQLTATPESETDPAFSSDGRLAYAVDSGDSPGIWVMSTETWRGYPAIPGGSRPSWSPSARKIAFVKEGAVWLAEGTDLAETSRITNFLGGPLDPAWSPDGEALFVWSEVDIDVMRLPLEDPADSEKLGLVPTGEQVSSLDVSGDGTTLFLTRGQYGGNMDVWSVSLDASSGAVIGEPQRLTWPISDDADVTASYDGSKVAFVARDVERDLYALQLDPATGMLTGARQRLTRQAPLNYYPALSADGDAVVWTRHSGAGLLYRMNLENLVFGEPLLAPEEKVTDTWASEVRETSAAFFPDARRIVFSSTLGGLYHLRQSLCSLCPSIPLAELGDVVSDYEPIVSPDGLVAFVSSRAGTEDIWLLSPDDGQRRLTSLEGAEALPAWSPDGRSVIFRSLQGDGADIWEVDIDGGEPRPLITRPGDQTYAEWSPDGSRLYFVSDESGAYELWMRDVDGTEVRVTSEGGTRGGLPADGLYTKFAIGSDKLIVPLEVVSGDLWVMNRSR